MTSVPFTLGRRVPARHLLLRLEAAGLAAHRDHQEQLRDRGAHRAPPLARHGRGARRTWLGLGSGLGLGLGLTLRLTLILTLTLALALTLTKTSTLAASGGGRRR